VGVYYLDKAFFTGTVRDGDWAFPDDNDFIPERTVDIADLTTNNLGVSLLSGGYSHVVIGTFGPDHSNAHPTAFNFELANIPEPSAGLMLTAGAGLLLRRRRRR
jgi:hypothetical protein